MSLRENKVRDRGECSGREFGGSGSKRCSELEIALVRSALIEVISSGDWEANLLKDFH